MPTEKPPTGQQIDKVMHLRGDLIATAFVLADSGSTARIKSDFLEVMAATDLQHERVLGNRPVSTKPTWADLRYVLAATLRAALAELDRAGGAAEVQVVKGS